MGLPEDNHRNSIEKKSLVCGDMSLDIIVLEPLPFTFKVHLDMSIR